MAPQRTYDNVQLLSQAWWCGFDRGVEWPLPACATGCFGPFATAPRPATVGQNLTFEWLAFIHFQQHETCFCPWPRRFWKADHCAGTRAHDRLRRLPQPLGG